MRSPESGRTQQVRPYGMQRGIGGSGVANKPKITFSTNPNARNKALIDGSIQLDGYDFEYVGDKYSPGEMHYRFVQGKFDVAEMSTATLMRAREKGKRFLALPVFFQRGPRQRNIFVREESLKHPSELKGKQIGAFRYGATAVSWARGFLLDDRRRGERRSRRRDRLLLCIFL